MPDRSAMNAGLRDPRGGFGFWVDRNAQNLLIMPAVLMILAFSIFPLLMSLYLALSRFRLVRGGYDVRFVGLRNFKKLLFGSEQYHFLGTFGEFTFWEWGIAVLAVGLSLYWLFRFATSPKFWFWGLVGRLVTVSVLCSLLFICLLVLNHGGFPGTLVVTLFYVLAGVAVQFSIGLALAVLCAQRLPFRNVFRLIFFVPLMVTPVGIAYAFRMLSDLSMGPFAPIWHAMGFANVSWANDPWSARLMVLTGESWQWIPFMFIVMLAAVENVPREQVESAKLDGAGGWRVFWDITWPSIAPVAATVILIRMIEAFKIMDFPNIMTNGGPGIATESLTLHAFIAWRTQNLGLSAAVGYCLLFVTAVVCVSFFNFVGRRVRERTEG
ncbi:MAG: sugar ABC transporter permease [Rhodospirillales bacterium]|nr:sugar ABC transporter permease [Rhodospirillales bacterium]